MSKDKIQGLIYEENSQVFRIRELEVSITSKCHLRCDNCGFYIPHQPSPTISDKVVSEIASGLEHLDRLNIEIGSLGILGGEPTFDANLLENALAEFSKFKNMLNATKSCKKKCQKVV